jgi:hypothetical protein
MLEEALGVPERHLLSRLTPRGSQQQIQLRAGNPVWREGCVVMKYACCRDRAQGCLEQGQRSDIPGGTPEIVSLDGQPMAGVGRQNGD